jgi:branched-chain amino acid transport system permease protein
MLSVLVASGLANGLLYALMALGIVVLAKAADAVNFSHGDLVTLGGLISFSAIVTAGMGPPAALVVVVIIAALIGAAMFGVLRTLLQPMYATSFLIATIGFSFFCRGVMRVVWGGQGDYLTVPPLTTSPPVILGGGAVIIPAQQLVMMAGGVAILLLFAGFFRLTRIGLFMRAVADNPRAAHIVGIPGPLVLCAALVLSVLVAAVSGYLLAPSTLLFPDLGFPLFTKGFAAAILGGITSLPGALIGGLILGLVESLVAGYVSSQIQDLSAFIVIFFTLLFLPRGLFAGQQKRAV